MKAGLRLQILLLLGASLLLAFTPLFIAVATYVRFALQQAHENSARTLGGVVAAHVVAATRDKPPSEFASWFQAQPLPDGVGAIGVYTPASTLLARSGDQHLLDELPTKSALGEPGVWTSGTPARRVLSVIARSDAGYVAVVVRAGDELGRATRLVGLVGLYTGVVALALLFLTYFAMTRLIVRPLGALSRSARRVAKGARHFEATDASSQELIDLAGSFRSMTEQLLAEEEALRRKIAEVEHQTRELAAAQTSLVRSERLASAGKLAVGLAHEIGNPIAALIGFEELLLAGGLDASEQRDFLERMRRETDRIHRILQDLLQFARPAQSSAEFASDPGDVAAAIEDTVALLRPQKALTDIELATDSRADLPKVEMSREHLTQVLLNLVLNAASATGPSGAIRVAAELVGANVRVSVVDDGPGVPDELSERIFEPFVTTKPPGEGTGLGLAVSRGLVEAAGGQITLDVTYRRGARFVVELPTLGVTAPAAAARSSQRLRGPKN